MNYALVKLKNSTIVNLFTLAVSNFCQLVWNHFWKKILWNHRLFLGCGIGTGRINLRHFSNLYVNTFSIYSIISITNHFCWMTNQYHSLEEWILSFYLTKKSGFTKNAENFSTKALAIKFLLFALWWRALADERLKLLRLSH